VRENFDKSVELLFSMEGYESDDPNDKGGYTKYGIAQAFNPGVDYQFLTREGAKQIYLERYWEPLGCDDQGYPLDMILFIQGVNMGERVKIFVKDSKGPLDVIMKCLNHYATREKSQRDRYLTGWCNRLIKLWEAL
jgi:hypothetical protein